MNAPTPHDLLLPDMAEHQARARVELAGLTAADEAAADAAEAQSEARQRRWWENLAQKVRDAVTPISSAPAPISFNEPKLGDLPLPPQPDTSAQALNVGTDLDDHTFNLYMAFNEAFPQEDTIAPIEAFEALKHLNIEHFKSDEGFLTLNNQAGTDPILIGINEDRQRFVLGKAEITAEEAMNRALAASMNGFMKEKGVRVHGTEQDQALLLVAAARTGLKVKDAPTLPPEVMAWAEQQFAALDEAKAAPLALVPADDERLETQEDPQAAGALDIDLAAMEAEAGPQAAGPVIEELAPSVAATAAEEPELATQPLDLDVSEPAAEAAPVIEELAPTAQPVDLVLPEEPAATSIIEVLEPSQPAAPDVAGAEDTTTEVSAPPVSAELPDDFAPVLVVPDAPAAEADTQPAAPAFEVDGEGYPILRDVVELGDLPRPLISAEERAALDEIAAQRAAAATTPSQLDISAAATVEPDAMVVVELPTAESILAEANVRPETYDQVKKFVAGREGDIIRPRDLVGEFAQAGVGTGKANALIAALEVDGLTQAEDNGGHRVVRRQSPQAGTTLQVG